ncbi:MAG: alpha/beta-type small acid-soluble spore protein [Alicyclobacillus herbarius]|uniref:alpha/beta-type small acid-soluble spore protein n=1 Tax=Alicyclobacillus herbarius TaxID=122960 RepID=UPI0004020570|nr:alpha/beta-type small acid-soluble spore protein [Alicyclobacillus herbarius]MCL6631066.1 alpha/beta-type small acid-soluble spore protein [Alicyclobacillus herbarius]
MARRRNRLLVPEAREAMDRLKGQVVADGADSQRNHAVRTTAAAGVGVPASANPRPRPQVEAIRAKDGGMLTTREAGELGGEIGGNMVKRLIQIAEKELAQRDQNPRS